MDERAIGIALYAFDIVTLHLSSGSIITGLKLIGSDDYDVYEFSKNNSQSRVYVNVRDIIAVVGLSLKEKQQ